MFLCDYHIHSNFSFDADSGASVDEICQSAIQRGLSSIAITDHLDLNYKYEYPELVYNAAKARRAIMEAKDKYKNKLDIAYGIELGQINQYPQDAKKIFNESDFEFVICSLHSLRNMKDFYFYFKEDNDFSPARLNELYSLCLDEICEQITLFGDKIDTLGHITYMHRYMAECGLIMDITPHKEKLEYLFSLAIKNDVALELNTSTLYKGLGFTMPTVDVMKMYRECGGRLITIGSDTHTPNNIGRGIAESIGMLQDIGFDSLLCVKDGKKQLVKI